MLLDDTPKRALAVFAHPDDPEVSCAGTLARWSAAGCESHLVICNAGEKGSPDASVDPQDLARLRAEEAAAAAAVMGLAGHEILGYPDGEIENNLELRGRLVERIRALRPDVVIAPDPTAVFFGSSYVNHHDHRQVGWAMLDAVAPAAANQLYFPSAGTRHRVGMMLLAGTLEPDAWVDIEDHLGTKIAALCCHRSQLTEEAAVVAEVVRARAEQAATAAAGGVRWAEGFRYLRFGA
ncbi:MAG: PIG-L deacetylase family protein [Acidimicrobiales bacterium]